MNEQKKNNGDNEELKKKIVDIETKLSNLTAKKNRDKVIDNFKALDGTTNAFEAGVWKIQKNVFPKHQPSPPSAKLDMNGKLVTSKEDIKQLYIDTFTHRLRDRPAKSGYENIQKLQEELCDERLKLTKQNKSPDWDMKDLEFALGKLKKNKARDPHEIANEIFRPEVAGLELKKSLVMMFNKMKSQTFIPEFARLKNISTIFKNKGSRLQLQNDRGVFVGSIFNNILMSLIHKDKNDIIDENMSDSQIGARKRKSTRNNTFIILGCINEAIRTKNAETDVIVTDIQECFDSLHLETSLNDLYDSGVKDDQLNLIFEADRSSLVAVKTSVGITERKTVEKKILQGEKLGPVICSNSVDKIGKECIENDKNLHLYRNETKIPPLAMVDDVIALAACGAKSAQMCAYLKAQANIMKLRFGVSKCYKIHVGKDKTKCPDLMLDNWKLEPKGEHLNSIWDHVDVEDESTELKSVSSTKYLGYIISSGGSNTLNINERVKRGLIAGNKIKQILEEITFGPYETEVFLRLRDSLFISTVLHDSEAWYNITDQDIKSLEDCDLMVLRQYFSLHSKCPRELPHLELGALPLRFVLMQKRILFLNIY